MYFARARGHSRAPSVSKTGSIAPTVVQGPGGSISRLEGEPHRSIDPETCVAEVPKYAGGVLALPLVIGRWRRRWWLESLLEGPRVDRIGHRRRLRVHNGTGHD